MYKSFINIFSSNFMQVTNNPILQKRKLVLEVKNLLEVSKWGSSRVQIYTHSVAPSSGLLTLAVWFASMGLSQSLQTRIPPGTHLSPSICAVYLLDPCYLQEGGFSSGAFLQSPQCWKAWRVSGRGRKRSILFYSLILQLNSGFCSKR